LLRTRSTLLLTVRDRTLIGWRHNGWAMQSPQLDKYARDARAWRDCAEVNYAAASELFGSGNLSLYFPAATLGHHALEMYLKSALICEGKTVFNPVILRSLDPGFALTRSDCVWGHCLVDLAKQLSEKRSDFDLGTEMDIPECQTLLMPITPETGLAFFDPFFSELRYPQDLKKSGVSPDLRFLLDALILRLPVLE
jgi:hypothetical protein